MGVTAQEVISSD